MGKTLSVGLMRSTIIFGVAVVVVILAACGGKPTGAEYLGRWTPEECGCVLSIKKVGASFFVESNVSAMSAGCDACRLTGPLTLSPEGNLTMGPMTVFVFDKTKNQMLFTTGMVYHLNKVS